VTTLLAFLLVLGVLIFVHELGHFLVARWYGVRVLTFSLGFGPKILKLTRGGTEYCISVIPLGGYVKMAGETTQDEREGAPDEFLSKSKWIRFQVYLAGPAMNVMLALAASAVVLSQGADVPKYYSQPAVIGALDPDGAALKAGVEAGDTILAVNGQPTPTWDAMQMSVLPKANRELTLLVDRGGQRKTITVTPDALGRFEAGSLGIRPRTRPQVSIVHAGRPAERAGFRQGDVVLAVNGEKGLDLKKLIARIEANGEQPMAFEIERDGQPTTISVTPEGPAPGSKIGATILDLEVTRVDPDWKTAIMMSFQQNWENTGHIGQTVKDLVTRETPMSQLLGPVGIAELSGRAAELGWIELLSLMAVISLQLGLLNLLPIPVLDGGQITILALEGIARRDMSMRMKEYFAMAGAVFIVALMVTVLYNDIARLVR
jgi:regulator of sigma E protease